MTIRFSQPQTDKVIYLFTSNRIFYCALVLSFFCHLAFIIYFSLANIPDVKSSIKRVEVTYTTLEKKKDNENIELFKDVGIFEEKREKKEKSVEILTKQDDVFPEIGQKIRDLSKLSDRLSMEKLEMPKTKSFDLEEKVSIPIFQAEKIMNPMYISHKQSIGQIIRRRAFQYVDHPDFASGHVYLTFVLSADGALKAVKIIEDKTSANEYIRNVALRSIREAAPFPPFPQGFVFPEVSFSLLIEFKGDSELK